MSLLAKMAEDWSRFSGTRISHEINSDKLQKSIFTFIQNADDIEAEIDSDEYIDDLEDF
ncbi:hypothetical protein [Lysinibacillus tabacifolii]|uniref:hypothetical protein n=1 Tax=Lysinibacillus tabacifolii TaxID=1173107 RepID=UPI00142E2F5F|nr:hypothetical protein [Lysinibacillus tabacifolii]